MSAAGLRLLHFFLKVHPWRLAGFCVIFSEIDGVFRHTPHIKNVETFFALLKKYYTLTASSDDKRQKYGYYMAENQHFPGYAGMFYDFTHISNDVFKKIVSEIKESFSQVLL